MYQVFPALTPSYKRILTAKFWVACKAVLLVLCCQPVVAAENSVRIAAWNIADFHHGIGVEAREHIGTKRYPADFKTLQRYAREIDADVIALQEIVTEAAARLLFPANKFWLFMSTRYSADLRAGAELDIYTAVAVRKGVGITPMKQTDLNALQIEPNGDNPYERSTRRGTAVLLDIRGESVWVMSVHLKSSCAKIKNPDRSRQRACKMLWQQAQSIRQWIVEKKARNSSFIIAGDFNRRFGRLKEQGSMWKLLSKPITGMAAIKRIASTKLRRCPSRKGKDVHPIDWFLLSQNLAAHYISDSYFETRWSQAETKRHRNRLSDHCPIHFDMQTNRWVG